MTFTRHLLVAGSICLAIACTKFASAPDAGADHAAGGAGGGGGAGGTDAGSGGSGGSGGGGNGSGDALAPDASDAGDSAGGCPGQKLCGSSCVSLNSNANCGDCGVTCTAAENCTAGHCLLVDGQPCTIAARCASGACNTFYRDMDADGYGDDASAAGFCTITTPPTGYVTAGHDCCDSGGNLIVARLIHPGADFQTTSAAGVCGITWDFDCSGTIEKLFQQLATACPATMPCNATYVDYPDADCGQARGNVGCANGGPGGPNACYTAGNTVTLGCK